MNSFLALMFYKNEIIALMIIVVIVSVSVPIIFWAFNTTKNYITETVIDTSKRYNELLEINSNYEFFDELKHEYVFLRIQKSKRQFDRFDFNKSFQEIIEDHLDYSKNFIYMINKNKVLFGYYNNDISKTYSLMSKDEIRQYKIPFKIYNRFEKKLLNDTKHKPVTAPYFIIKNEYTSPKGQNHYENHRTYTFQELIYHLGIVQEKLENEDSKEYQRNKMTDSLRYDILKRDGFRCVLCGRTAGEGVKLHVDHIVPVSKGGKTIHKNLRTLCESCNWGKSDKYDEYGYN